ncbi:MAG: hypothetical protein KIH01_04035 [Candidatus Freyarchaeota archaeon]|nr:hypothetical protein [Candidatus Jordarchaeia archaeon]
MSDERRVEIEVEVIKTPVGEVPTVKTIERVIDGLNALGKDVGVLSLSVSEVLKSITADMKALQKTMSKTTVSSEAAAEAVKRLERKLDQLSQEEAERWNRLQQILALITEALKDIHNDVNEKTLKATSRINKLISLLAPPSPTETPPAKAKPLKKAA